MSSLDVPSATLSLTLQNRPKIGYLSLSSSELFTLKSKVQNPKTATQDKFIRKHFGKKVALVKTNADAAHLHQKLKYLKKLAIHNSGDGNLIISNEEIEFRRGLIICMTPLSYSKRHFKTNSRNSGHQEFDSVLYIFKSISFRLNINQPKDCVKLHQVCDLLYSNPQKLSKFDDIVYFYSDLFKIQNIIEYSFRLNYQYDNSVDRLIQVLRDYNVPKWCVTLRLYSNSLSQEKCKDIFKDIDYLYMKDKFPCSCCDFLFGKDNEKITSIEDAEILRRSKKAICIDVTGSIDVKPILESCTSLKYLCIRSYHNYFNWVNEGNSSNNKSNWARTLQYVILDSYRLSCHITNNSSIDIGQCEENFYYSFRELSNLPKNRSVIDENVVIDCLNIYRTRKGQKRDNEIRERLIRFAYEVNIEDFEFFNNINNKIDWNKERNQHNDVQREDELDFYWTKKGQKNKYAKKKADKFISNVNTNTSGFLDMYDDHDDETAVRYIDTQGNGSFYLVEEFLSFLLQKITRTSANEL